jgi:hypothetical protein
VPVMPPSSTSALSLGWRSSAASSKRVDGVLSSGSPATSSVAVAVPHAAGSRRVFIGFALLPSDA